MPELKPAGIWWCSQWPTSTSLDDLMPTFAQNCKEFIAELESRGAQVKISATYRPPERAYLMNHCCMIAQAKQDPKMIKPMAGVAIQWDLGTPLSTRAASSAMMRGYGIAFPAALVSRHTQRRAIDMTVTGGPTGSELYELGKSFGVIKLIEDPPHWSDDGH